MHGGTIRAESAGISGQGSRFIFSLPSSPLERETAASGL
jgi:signal transduction histidine kinase